MLSFIKKIFSVNLSMFLIILLMTGLISFSLFSYIKVQQSLPLENLHSAFVEPVYEEQDMLEVKGTFDRAVACQLIDFELNLLNIETHDIVTLNKSHLVKSPAPIVGPGTDIKINFALSMPKAMYPGRWQPTFTGEYICKYGIFLDLKLQKVTISSFLVLPKR